MTHLDAGADLRAVMERSLRDLDAPQHCGPAAVASGRRMRTRRRVAVGLGGVAAIAAVAALALPTLGGSDDAADGGFAAEPTQTPTTSSDLPTIPPGSPTGWWDRPSREMAEVLESRLPDAVSVVEVVTTTDGEDPPVESRGDLMGVLEGPTGKGTFQVILYPPAPTDVPDPTTSTDAAGNSHSTAHATTASHASRIRCRAVRTNCEEIVDGSGDQIGRISTMTERGTLLYEVALLGPDGGALNFTVMNSTGEKPGYEPPTADAPPLTIEQLSALAQDPAWTSYAP